MGAWGAVGAILSAGLALGPVPLSGPEPTAPAAGPTAAAAVPCPYTTIPTIPPTPPAPARDPAAPLIGGPRLGTVGLSLPAGAPPPPTLSAMSWLVADLDSGDVLAACAPHARRRPASVQKLLLAAAALPLLDPNLVVEATAEDLDLPRDSSMVGLIVGGHYPVSTLWYGLLLESGNDAATALARVAGGPAGVPGTIAAMNAEAHRLGADDTHAVTPSGYDAPDQFTSAYDLALIARADFARPDFVQYDTLLRMQWPPQPPKDPHGFQIQNENKLLTSYPGALGGKTGFTDQARHTYVGAAQRGGRRLVVTLMGAEIVPGRGWQQGAMLLDWAFTLPATATVGHLVTPAEAERIHNPPPSPTAVPPGTGPARAAPPNAPRSTPPVLLVGLIAAPLLIGAAVAVPVIRRRHGTPAQR